MSFYAIQEKNYSSYHENRTKKRKLEERLIIKKKNMYTAEFCLDKDSIASRLLHSK